MDQSTGLATRKDYELGVFAGAVIGILLLPILATIRPSAYDSFHLVIIPFFLIASPLGLFIAAQIGRFVPIIWQIAKFVLIGVLNTLVDIGSLAAIEALFLNTAVANFGVATLTIYSLYKATSFVIANTNSYIWNKYWTFSGTVAKKDASTQFIQFFAVSIVGFLINIFVASFVFTTVHPLSGMNASQWGLIGAAFGSIAGLAWNFVGYKLIVFKK